MRPDLLRSHPDGAWPRWSSGVATSAANAPEYAPQARHGGIMVREVMERASEEALLLREGGKHLALRDVQLLQRALPARRGPGAGHHPAPPGSCSGREQAQAFRRRGQALPVNRLSFPCTGMTKKLRKEMNLTGIVRKPGRQRTTSDRSSNGPSMGRVAVE